MNIFFNSLITLILISTANISIANDNPVKFQDIKKEQRYYALLEEVRCLVCQNQSLADSNAELAQDLRNEIYQMLIEGKDNKKIIEFLVARYGDFVLYRPPLQENTWLLWFGPLLFFLTGIIIAVFLIKKQANEESIRLSEQDQLQLSEIINNNSDENET